MSEMLAWNRALTVSERDFLIPQTPVGSFDPDLAGDRIKRWRQESALVDDAKFSLRLAQQGLDETRFTQLLGSPAPATADAPAWLKELKSAYAEASGGGGMPTEAANQLPEAVFLDVVRPLLDHAWRRLEGRLEDLGTPAGRLERFAALWARPLPRQLLWMVTRTLILELRISRLENRLEGSTPQERFESFLAPLRQGAGALELLATYPVLGRALVGHVGQWLDNGVELGTRLLADLPALEAAFGRPLGDLVDLDPDLGDRHDNGRTVVSLELSSGTKIVYKPRCLALDERFQELLTWLDEQGIEPRLRTLRVLDRGAYGWVEFVEPAACRSAAEVRRFYARQGVYLALLHVLVATDFHHENLIAAGEHPVLIDLETLFQPILADPVQPPEEPDPTATSVLRTGLLPERSKPEAGRQGVDLSGLAARRGQPRPMRELCRVGTDEMGFVERECEIPIGRHLPSLDGEEIALAGVSEVILESFVTASRRLMELRTEFLEPGGWLESFAGLETRVIPRPTGLYDRISYLGYHPDHLQDALHRERLFDKLWLDAERLAYVSQLIPYERHDLLRGDFPRFTSRTDSRDLFASSGTRLADALPESGLDLARRCLASFGDRELERQLALARLALQAARPPGKGQLGQRRVSEILSKRQRASVPGPEDFLTVARRVGLRLELLAMRSQESISWFHLKPAGDGFQVLEPVEYDLYDGLGGIALFFAQLGKATGEPHFTDLARRALAVGREQLEREPESQLALGGFSGLGGWIYTLTSLGVLWECPELLDEAESTCGLVPPAMDNDENLDVVAGAAGCIAGLLALYRHRPGAAVLELATSCGEHLLGCGEAQEHGFAWRLPHIGERPLAGFAHGAAGIAWALARLFSHTGEVRFAEAARGAVAYERGLFSPEHGNWPNLGVDRPPEEGWSYSHAWCHGAPGIGLARLGLVGLWSDAEIEEEIRVAIRTTRAHGFGERHCLCHGNLGNLELLVRAARQLDDPELGRTAGNLAGRVLASLEAGEYHRGLDQQVDLPGLMTGLAGIGYGLLRLASPDTVPSVLLLEAP